jgi:S-DNA-T family DNA segregation ATPase FtsK/SpoIIIE
MNNITAPTLQARAVQLEEALAAFRVVSRVTRIIPGPVVTQYRLDLFPGTKVSKVTSLAPELSLALNTKNIKITVNTQITVEIPNDEKQMVGFEDVINSMEFKDFSGNLKMALGKDSTGKNMVLDLAKIPHVLIAGQTGSGKSVCINSFVSSLVKYNAPDTLKMILIDPKMVEMMPYNNIPHLLFPVITETAKEALEWAITEMENRYEILAQTGTRNIAGFNAKHENGILPKGLNPDYNKKMPYIVIVIDELADLMMTSKKEMEGLIVRIAQKARAVGIHLIVATQRPSVNVVTGLIKANVPARITFKLPSKTDSFTVLDGSGAESLTGAGDGLLKVSDAPDGPVRFHGCYISDDQCGI